MKVKVAGGVYLYWDWTNMFIVNGLPKWLLVPHWTYCGYASAKIPDSNSLHRQSIKIKIFYLELSYNFIVSDTYYTR